MKLAEILSKKRNATATVATVATVTTVYPSSVASVNVANTNNLGLNALNVVQPIAELASTKNPIRDEALKDRQREVGRRKSIDMMIASPNTARGVYVDDLIDPDNVVLFLALRVSQLTCELRIPRDKYDQFTLLTLIEKLDKNYNQGMN